MLNEMSTPVGPNHMYPSLQLDIKIVNEHTGLSGVTGCNDMLDAMVCCLRVTVE